MVQYSPSWRRRWRRDLPAGWPRDRRESPERLVPRVPIAILPQQQGVTRHGTTVPSCGGDEIAAEDSLRLGQFAAGSPGIVLSEQPGNGIVDCRHVGAKVSGDDSVVEMVPERGMGLADLSKRGPNALGHCQAGALNARGG